MKDPYLYDDVPILKNKLNIKDQEKLELAEADITAITCIDVDKINTPDNQIDFEYLKKIHRHIFQDIYEFAGEVRTVPVFKEEPILGGDSIRYSHPNTIEKDANLVLDEMKKVNWETLTMEQKATVFSKQIAGIWQTHPFREGNTRTTMTFASHFAERNGFPLDKQLFKEHSDYVRNALVKASDGPYSDYSYLTRIMKDSIVLGTDAANIKDLRQAGFRPTENLVNGMRKMADSFGKIVSVKELRDYYKNPKQLDPEKQTIVKEVAEEFVKAEKAIKHFKEFEL